MVTRWAARPAPALVITALLIGSYVPPVAAKKPKISATINGKGYRYKGRYVGATTSDAGTIVVATKPARPGATLRTIGFACAYNLQSETFPLVANPQYCTGTLSEQKIGGSFATKSWFAPSGIAVTFESFDGTWASGTFSGTLDPSIASGAEGPATYGGTFKIKVTGPE